MRLGWVSAFIRVLGATALLPACQPDLGKCDMDAARSVVYDEDGFPAYEGQALMSTSCGNGAFCHSRAAKGSNRFGVPKGLNWDMQIASTDHDENRENVETLRRGQRNIYDWRYEIYSAVDSGYMPPKGSHLAVVYDGVPHYDVGTSHRTALAAITSKEGKASLKNWLACGSPVVERTLPLANNEPTTVGDWVGRGPSAPPEPFWSEIYTRVIARRCVQCHRPDAPQFADNQLDMSTADVAYENLVGIAAMGAGCNGMGTRVVAGDPDASLLIEKLGASPSCGDTMPLGASRLPSDLVDPIRMWIENGARNE